MTVRGIFSYLINNVEKEIIFWQWLKTLNVGVWIWFEKRGFLKIISNENE
jgi:hypothetical protein